MNMGILFFVLLSTIGFFSQQMVAMESQQNEKNYMCHEKSEKCKRKRMKESFNHELKQKVRKKVSFKKTIFVKDIEMLFLSKEDDFFLDSPSLGDSPFICSDEEFSKKEEMSLEKKEKSLEKEEELLCEEKEAEEILSQDSTKNKLQDICLQQLINLSLSEEK